MSATAGLELHVYHDAAELARGAADRLATEIVWAQRQRGTAHVACSGGETPRATWRALARHPIDWAKVHLYQVDERVAPDGDPARNATALLADLVEPVGMPAGNVHLMRVTLHDLDDAARQYARTLDKLPDGGFDIVQLGVGADGHTASLVPGDPSERSDEPVVVTGVYQGHRRITITNPVLRAARRIVWLVEGEEKADALRRLVAADPAVPAGRVAQDRAVVYCDEAAVRLLDFH